MPRPSIFTPCGLMRCTSKPSAAKSIYQAKISALGGNFDVSAGTRVEAKAYAEAIGEARVRSVLERAGNQATPFRVLDLMNVREQEFGLIPAPSDTIKDRRDALASRYLLPGGAKRTNVENALRTLLGDDFVRYYVGHEADEADQGMFPAALGDQPMNLQLDDVPRKLVRIPDGVSLLGVRTVTYERAIPIPDGETYTDKLLVGDVLVVNPETLGQEERVEVTAVDNDALTFTATFTESHDVDCLATTAPYPMWSSSLRQVIVVLKPDAANDPETRRKVDELFARMMKEVTQWAIVEETEEIGGFGPFLIGESPIGVTSLGAVAPA